MLTARDAGRRGIHAARCRGVELLERCQRIADTWGGGPSARMVARGIVGMLEAAASEWIEQAPCSLEDATVLITGALWDGVGRFPRPVVPA